MGEQREESSATTVGAREGATDAQSGAFLRSAFDYRYSFVFDDAGRPTEVCVEASAGRALEVLSPSQVPWLEVAGPADRDLAEERLAKLRGGATDVAVLRIKLPDGATRWVRDRAAPLPGPDGVGRRVFGVGDDVTVEHEREQGLGRERQTLRDLVALSSDWLFETNELLELVYSNDACRALLGHRPSSLEGLSLYSLLTEEGASTMSRELGQTLASHGEIDGFDAPVSTASGDVVWVSLSMRPRFEGGAFIGYVGAGKALFEQQAVIPDKARPSPAQSNVQLAEAPALHLPFDLHAELRAALVSLAARARAKGLELVYDTSPEVPSMLLGDAAVLRQVIVSLVDNAIKFTESGGVVLRVRCLHGGDARVTLSFELRDTGVGIDDARKAMLFERASTVDPTATRPAGDTGLGLAIASHLVRRLGSSLALDSAPGAGSTFRFAVTFERQQGARDDGLAPGLWASRAVVLAERPMARAALRQLLAEWGVDAVVFTQLEPLVAWLAQGSSPKVSSVIVDAASDLLGAVARIRSEGKFADRIVALHEGAEPSLPAAMGPLFLIAKPFSPPLLVEALGAGASDQPASSVEVSTVPAAPRAQASVAQSHIRSPLAASMRADALPNQPPVVDEPLVERTVGGSAEILAELLGLQESLWVSSRAELDAVLAAGSTAGAERLAHLVRGSLVQLGALRAASLAGKLEEAIQQRATADARALLPALDLELAQALTLLRSIERRLRAAEGLRSSG